MDLSISFVSKIDHALKDSFPDRLDISQRSDFKSHADRRYQHQRQLTLSVSFSCNGVQSKEQLLSDVSGLSRDSSTRAEASTLATLGRYCGRKSCRGAAMATRLTATNSSTAWTKVCSLSSTLWKWRNSFKNDSAIRQPWDVWETRSASSEKSNQFEFEWATVYIARWNDVRCSMKAKSL
jgi:hypothetical protein